MFCKFCGRELEPEEKQCPDCGKTVGGSDGWKIAVIILSALILGTVLVLAVLFGTGVLGGNDKKAEESVAPTTEITEPTETTGDVTFTSYTVDDTAAAEKASEVVATVGDQTLTNSELQLHYWSAVYNFLNQYGYYLSAFGMDPSVGLDQQACYLDTTISWQEYFLNQALESWQGYAVLIELANDEGYVLDAEDQEYVDTIRAKIESDAKDYGYASVEEMIMKEAGPGCNVDGLAAYRQVVYVSLQYFADKYEDMTPTADEVSAYFEENAADFEASGVTKDSGKVNSVRHILIKAEGTTDENGNTVYSDEAWAACLAEAERVYQLWKDGEATEDSFVALVAEHTDDDGSKTTGGLYENVSMGSGYVEPFETWASEASRQPGDTGLVKVESTNYAGYHFMYYVSSEDVWYSTASAQLLDERFAEFMNGGLDAYPMEVIYEKIALGYISLTEE